MPLAFDPFLLHAREATPLGEARAVGARMRAYASDQGNAQYLRKLIYEDSATIVSLIPQIEATGNQEAIADVYQAASVCGNAGEVGGNIGMWPQMTIYADKLDTALDLIEGGEPPPIVLPPANVDAPYISQAGTTLHCTMGNWNNMDAEPHSYAWQWWIDSAMAGAGATYTLQVGDVGKMAICSLTAANAAGAATVDSNAVTIVSPV